ncbi:DUF6609 family protein (plasmid) [Streptomyces sp. CA-294286]|uniref:DUF6609 family protein n=1 Tax=Streptomyces sp. CA-294286 TaxID=3240070 RepID=UPI003D8B9C0F
MNASTFLALTDVSHPYPLIRGGGLFLLFVGLGFLLGWIYQRRWIPLVIGGGVAGFAASGLSALLPSLGTPSFAQIAGLVASFVLEMGLIYLVISHFQRQQAEPPHESPHKQPFQRQQAQSTPQRHQYQQDLQPGSSSPSDSDERTLILRILLVVGLHFLVMGIAHGPLMTVLGLASTANALVGLYVAKWAPLRALGVTDAVLKLGFGTWMLVGYPAVTFA